MKRIPKYYKDYKYEVKYLWQLVAETLILEPWEQDMVARAEAAAKAQWERLGVELDTTEY
ncbi:MAG: (Fe-S)-binding protein, partial [Proteobacteria bacterium]|nr:(Fe-S)-binding protein [Pseudomonadota bacterium]